MEEEGIAVKSYGQIAYRAYAKSSNGRSLISGALLSPWEDLDSAIRDAWLAAAQAVTEEYKRQNDVSTS